MKQLLLAFAVAGAMSGSALAQGIPVIDATNIAKSIEQITHQLEQIEKMKEQLDQAKALYDSMNQITDVNDLAGLLKSDDIQRALPDEIGQIQTALGDLSDGFASQYDHYDTSGSSANNFYLQELNRQKRETYGDLSIGQKVYETASARIDELNKLRDAVGSAQTAKEIEDLQARIAAESALLQNDQIKMQALTMIQQSRDRVDEAREREERAKRIEERRKVYEAMIQ